MGRAWRERSSSVQQSFVGKVDLEIWGRGKCFLEGVVADKYGIMDSGWRTKNTRTPFRCGLCRLRGGKFFTNTPRLRWGWMISFWAHWCREVELKEVFPS